MPANRPATERTQSLRPLFSWMTSRPPRALAASAHAPASSPCGPDQVTGAVGNAVSDPGACGLAVAGWLVVTAPVDVAGASDVGFLLSLHAAISDVAAAVPTPSSASLRRASRLDSNPSTWSVAISSAMYRCSGVTFASIHRQCRRRLDASGFA